MNTELVVNKTDQSSKLNVLIKNREKTEEALKKVNMRFSLTLINNCNAKMEWNLDIFVLLFEMFAHIKWFLNIVHKGPC